MIKFFRKIRQNFLMENKTSKYFKYAIGEIVLVVIGILIALQINNWNEKKKKLETGLQYLSEMRYELESDVEMLDFFINKLKQNIQNQEAAMKSKDIYQLPIDSLNMILSSINLDFKISELTYNKMKNLGISVITENKKLNSKITHYYNEEVVSLKLAIDYVFKEFKKYQDFFLYKQETISYSYEEFPRLLQYSVKKTDSINRINMLKFIKSTKGRNLVLNDLDSKRYSLTGLKIFLGTTVSLLNTTFDELKKQDKNIRPLIELPKGYSFKEIQLSYHTLKKYVGNYKLEDIGNVKIFYKENALYMNYINKKNIKSNEVKLFPYDKNKFFIKDYFQQVHFNIIEDSVVSLTLKQQGVREFKKITND